MFVSVNSLVQRKVVAYGDYILLGRGLLNLKITHSLLIHCLQKFPAEIKLCREKEFLHMKSLFGQLGGTYHEGNGYLIPDLRLPDEEEKTIGILGQRHLEYLKQQHKGIYINLITSGRMNTYLANIDKQAQERFEMLVEQMKQAQRVTKQLKEENALEWVGLLNNIRACAREIVNSEIVYV